MKNKNSSEQKSFNHDPHSINHPCFNPSALSKWGRMHLPVAPDCNMQCNYCNRVYDCVNEGRPGVTSRILTPEEAYEKYLEVKEKVGNIAIAGFAGPGDPLANFDEVRQTANLIRQTDKKVGFCLSTNGLLLPQYAKEIIEAGFLYVTVTVNTLDTGIGANIYEHINYKGEIYTDEIASELLINNQLEGLSLLIAAGVTCKINTLFLKGINDGQIENIADMASKKGVYIMNINNLIPVEGSKFEKIKAVSASEIEEAREISGKYINQMRHCQQCRADSVGLLTQDRFKEFYS